MNQNQNQQNKSVFVTKLKERVDRTGTTYLIGNIGMATIMIRRHKTNPDEWNFILNQAQPRNNGQNQSNDGGNGFNFSEEIPF